MANGELLTIIYLIGNEFLSVNRAFANIWLIGFLPENIKCNWQQILGSLRVQLIVLWNNKYRGKVDAVVNYSIPPQ